MQRSQSKHAQIRAQQRGIPPLIEQWLDAYGEEEYDSRGGILRYFSHRSIRSMERHVGREPVRRFTDYLAAYQVVSANDGCVITVGFRNKHIRRK